MWHTDNTQGIHKQTTRQNLLEMEQAGLSKTISYVAHIMSAQSQSDNPIARAK